MLNFTPSWRYGLMNNVPKNFKDHLDIVNQGNSRPEAEKDLPLSC